MSKIGRARRQGALRQKVVEMAMDALSTESGKRVTALRRALLDIIRTTEGHLDASELYQSARREQPFICLSAVYRSLRMFKKLGLIREHQFGSARRRYETKFDIVHHHLVCLGCERIIESKRPSTERLKTKIGKEKGIKVGGG